MMRLTLAASLACVLFPFAALAQDDDETSDEPGEAEQAPEGEASSENTDNDEDKDKDENKGKDEGQAADPSNEDRAKEVVDFDDLDFQEAVDTIRKGIDGLEAEVRIDVEWHESDNLDFRPLDEASQQARMDSDDRQGFAFTSLGIKLTYKVNDPLRFVVGATHRGMWGGDNIGSVNVYGTFLYFTDVYIDYAPAGNDGIRFLIGRQPIEIGGLRDTRDYVWADIVEAVRVDIPVKGVGTLVLLPIEVPDNNADFDDNALVGSLAGGSDVIQTFRGDTMTRRHGAMFAFDRLETAINLDARVYSFFTDVAAASSGTGADISRGGLNGNFGDNDWVLNYGVRASVGLMDDQLGLYAQFEGSAGLDRKELLVRDADTNGFAWGGGAKLDLGEERGFRGRVGYFESWGQAFDADGMLASHGYVGMKGRHVGGYLTNRLMALHPTAYVHGHGVTEPREAHMRDRKGGTRLIDAQAGFDKLVTFGRDGGLSLRAGWYFLQDTGLSAVDFAEVGKIDPPFGYARAEIEAQERLGRVLGNELDLDLFIDADDVLSFNLTGGVFLPGAFYDIPITRIAGRQLGGQEVGWSVYGGTHMRF